MSKIDYSLELNEYCINLNSINRDISVNENPLKFTVWLNDDHRTSTLNRYFTNVKFVNFEYIIFPYYIKLTKTKMKTTNSLYNDIITILPSTGDVNTQTTYNSNTYEICNKVITDISTVNFTMNSDISNSYEYINNAGTITVNIYSPIKIDSPGNHIQYISIQPCDNKYVFNTTGNSNYFRHVFPKLKKTSDLYLSTKKSYIEFKNSELLDIKKINVELLDLNCNAITISNLDYNTQTYSEIGLNETPSYTHPTYYLRHPFNPKFQIDIFLKVGCCERKVIKESVFNK